MTYDPFERGSLPVGVRTVVAVDAARGGRTLPVEVWYPATDELAGRDLAPDTCDRFDVLPGFPPAQQQAVRDATPRTGSFPLIVFSHGFGGHRRQSTFVCTHLASHGYVVAAPDHTGNTLIEVFQAAMALQMGGAKPDVVGMLRSFVELRPTDVSFTIDGVLDGSIGGVADVVDATRIGMAGHSFGGWTTLVTTARDQRIRAALPLAPAGGASPLPVDVLRDSLDFAWGREVPTLFLVAELDSLLPLDGMPELLERTPSRQKKMVVLEKADHMHFCDRIEEVHEMVRMLAAPMFAEVADRFRPISELCAPEPAYRFARGLALAHMDAHLRARPEAARLLEDDLPAVLAAQGIAARIC
jgi:predicted dienelactone hydrolase